MDLRDTWLQENMLGLEAGVWVLEGTWGEGQNEGASLCYLSFFYLLFASRRIINIPRMGVTVL
jgi:hypothetical protein